MRRDHTSTLTHRQAPESYPHEAELAAARAQLAAAHVKIENLEVALATRGTIGTATGIIMATTYLLKDARPSARAGAPSRPVRVCLS